LFVMTTQVQRYLDELFVDESKVWECARQTHIQQSSRFSNFSRAVELFKSDSFKDQ
jgi:pterin-4a-carbinolamine dehydratase